MRRRKRRCSSYLFNETGSHCLSSGSVTNGVTMRNGSDVATDLHNAAGDGVRGGLALPGADTDRSFDNTAAPAMGNTVAVNCGYAAHDTDADHG
jgi:hypothetical protein